VYNCYRHTCNSCQLAIASMGMPGRLAIDSLCFRLMLTSLAQVRAWYSPNGRRCHSSDACYATLMGDKSSTHLVTSLLPAPVMYFRQGPTYRCDASEPGDFVGFLTIHIKSFLFLKNAAPSKTTRRLGSCCLFMGYIGALHTHSQ
jgi:hypothetical protein